MVYFQVTNPQAAVYSISNYIVGVEQLTTTTLRNVVGGMTLEQTLTSRDQINGQLRGVLDEATGKWGLRVARVELRSIDPPPSIQESMEKQMKADREKRAMILTAEGVRESSIKQAEGQKQSQILAAEGAKQAAILAAEAERQSRILRAQGERAAQYLQAQGQAKAIEKTFAAIKAGRPTPELLAYQYLQTLPMMAKGEANKVWMVPSDFGSALQGFTKMLGAPGEDGVFRYTPSPVETDLPQARGRFGGGGRLVRHPRPTRRSRRRSPRRRPKPATLPFRRSNRRCSITRWKHSNLSDMSRCNRRSAARTGPTSWQRSPTVNARPRRECSCCAAEVGAPSGEEGGCGIRNAEDNSRAAPRSRSSSRPVVQSVRKHLPRTPTTSRSAGVLPLSAWSPDSSENDESDRIYVRHRAEPGQGHQAPRLSRRRNRLAHKLIEAAQSRRRAVNAPHLVALVRAGAKFEKGKLVERPDDATATGEAA